MPLSRRRLLEIAAGGALPLAGCTGGDAGDAGGGTSPTETPTRTPTDTATSTPTSTATPTSTPSSTPTETPTSTTTETPTPTGTPSLTPTETSSPTPTPTPTPTETGAEQEIAEKIAATGDNTFDPRKASVEVGATVQWRNDPGAYAVDHTVTSAQFHDVAADWDFDVTIAPNETTTYTFESTGIYEYYCTIHGRDAMCGAVLVGDVTLDEQLPCADGDDGDGGY